MLNSSENSETLQYTPMFQSARNSQLIEGNPLKIQIKSILQIHFPFLERNQYQKIFMFDSVQEIINSILICIKKEYTDKIAKVDFKIKSMESKLEKEESQNFINKAKLEELTKQVQDLSRKLIRKQQECRRKEDSEFDLKTKIQKLQKQVLITKTNYHRKNKELKLQVMQRNERLFELQNQMDYYSKEVKEIKEMEIERQRERKFEQRTKNKSAKKKKKQKSLDKLQKKQEVQNYDNLLKQIKQLRENQSMLLDRLAEKDQLIQEFQIIAQ